MGRTILDGTNIFDCRFMSGYNLANTQQTLSADYTMAQDPPPVSIFNGGTANRNIFLPPISGNTSSGFMDGRNQIIINSGTTANLNVRVNSVDNALTPLVAELLPGAMGWFYEGKGAWFYLGGTGGGLSTSAYNIPRNMIDGGDFTTNPFQRGTSFSAISNTVTYGADRFFAVGGASSSISMSQQAQTDVAGFANSLRWGRGAGTNTAQINLGQVIETKDSVRAQGQQVTLSFWAKAGAQFSAANSALTVQLQAGTGTDQSAANMIAGSWTGQTQPINTTQVLTTSAVRYTFTGTVPANATQLGVQFSYAPTGTNNTTDTVDFYGIQLEVGSATPFEHMDIQFVIEECQRYAWVTNEPAAGVVVGTGSLNSTTAAIIYMATPVQMRTAPTVTVTAGSFGCTPAGAARSGTIAAGSTHTVNAITVNVSGITASTAGFGTPLVGGGGAGVITASADF